MKAADLIKYIHNPALLNRESVSQLKKLTEDFPYFQPAHLLLSVASRKWDASLYQQSLKKTAIVATNRAHLFRLIHQVETEKNAVEEAAVQTREDLKEESRQELEILKAAEIVSELPVETIPEAETKKETLSTAEKEARPRINPEQVLQKEIEKEVVKSFVETRILKTPELNRQEEKPAPESFADWLTFLKKNNGQPYEEIQKQVEGSKVTLKSEEPEQKENKETLQPEQDKVEARKLKNKAIIDKIIENSPGIIRAKEEQRFYAPDLKAKESLLENEHLVTETLAKIYALQGSVNKAIRAYEILGLKFPQKRAYYDDQIQKLKSGT